MSLVGQGSEYSGTTYTYGIGVTEGTSYQFKVRAANKWGFGNFSGAVTILAAGVPELVTSVTTAIDPTTGGVKISWTEPEDNYDAITAYTVEVKDSGSVWQEDLTNCDGSQPLIQAQLYCIIPMSVFSGTWGLSYDDLIEV